MVIGDLDVMLVDAESESIEIAQHVQLGARVSAVVVHPDVWPMLDDDATRLLVHNVVANLAPRGQIATSQTDTLVAHALACGLEPVATSNGVARWRRTDRVTIHDLVAEARANLQRVSASDLAARWEHDPDLVVLDTRTPTDRTNDGVIEGSIHAPRTVLEWLADPASGYRHPCIHSFDQMLVVLCSEGYSSSLAAASLQRLGFKDATDLIGGVRAWRVAGLPLISPNNQHQELKPRRE